MKEKLINALGDKLNHLEIVIDDVYTEEENKIKYLRVVLNRDKVLNSQEVYDAAKIIDPIIDELDMIDDSYILDVYAKEKGEDYEW